MDNFAQMENTELGHFESVMLMEENIPTLDTYYDYEIVKLDHDYIYFEPRILEDPLVRVKEENEACLCGLNEVDLLRREHNYCLLEEGDVKTSVAFWKKQVQKLKLQLSLKNQEIKKADEEIESIKNHLIINKEIIKQFRVPIEELC